MPLDWKAFGAAIRAFYGLKEAGNGTPAVVPAAAPVVANDQTKSESEALVKVRQLMESAEISEPEPSRITSVSNRAKRTA